MTASDQNSADERFERLLLDSAQSDELPRHVDAAWHDFDRALHGVRLLAAGVGSALAARRAQRWLAAKWLIWGALAGSALTALSLRPRHDRRVEPSTVLSSASAIAALPGKVAPAPIAIEAQQRAAAGTDTSLATPVKPASRSHRPTVPTARAEGSASQSSTLAAQVALLDAARGAMANAAHAEALRLADRYRADFPNGELAPEAEVVAIEALVARGARQSASERAARFLARYPGDPHAARVKWLVR